MSSLNDVDKTILKKTKKLGIYFLMVVAGTL